ncbi:DNA-binding transcriptional regulator, MarR family [Succinivibrio dextrinosolvens DSM 3072]|uniref:DNA-binding transcriptional regulator, MarR family n=1 Tax=Succinivibrio dextrinosolvens DSM 3072 TaxID=1123324 RepID=A0A1T4VRG9_9GAMM|nr:MarR family transcriptional regulator [Succinivibrio dextrinosolvens]SKA67091.1 DNA-binding transcriptional regulator, MarR family [Succinivibrio dextrinosolvens DSM 3072]
MKHCIVAMASALHRCANDYLELQLKEKGLTGIVPSHGDILVNLYQKESLTMQELARLIKRTKATTTVLVDKLEKQGLVTRIRSPKDGRSTLVTLTEKGTSYEDVFNQIGENLNQRVMNQLTEDEANLLEGLLNKAISGFTQK